MVTKRTFRSAKKWRFREQARHKARTRLYLHLAKPPPESLTYHARAVKAFLEAYQDKKLQIKRNKCYWASRQSPPISLLIPHKTYRMIDRSLIKGKMSRQTAQP